MFGTQLLRALWILFTFVFIINFYDVAMLAHRCDQSTSYCLFAWCEVIGITSCSAAAAMGIYIVCPPVLRRVAVMEMRQAQEDEDTPKQTWGADTYPPHGWQHIAHFPDLLGRSAVLLWKHIAIT